jgi:hypothetical protein
MLHEQANLSCFFTTATLQAVISWCSEAVLDKGRQATVGIFATWHQQ